MSHQLNRLAIVAALVVTGLLTSLASAQNSAEQAARLRTQLADVQAKEAEQQTRVQQLEEALKPENIEHSLAGVGSTHPEELREQRRRQLEKERTGVRAQLDQLAVSRTRLETAIAAADARAYQESARGPLIPAADPQPTPVEPAKAATAPQPQQSIKKNRRRHARRSTRPTPPVTPVRH